MSLIKQYLEQIGSVFSGLDQKIVAEIDKCLVLKQYGFGELIIAEGSEADGFYILVSGKARAFKEDDSREFTVGILRAGDSFGEKALLESSCRTASVRASSEVEILFLDKNNFTKLVNLNPEFRKYLTNQLDVRDRVNFLTENIAVLKLPAPAVRKFATDSELLTWEQGKGIDISETFMAVVTKGVVAVRRKEKTYYFKKGEYFGLTRIDEEVVKVSSWQQNAEVLFVDSSGFEMLICEYPEFAENAIPLIEFSLSKKKPTKLPLDVALREKKDTAEMSSTSVRGMFFPFIQQIDANDCGPACLTMTARYFGLDKSLADIRSVCNTGRDGADIAALEKAAEEIGLTATRLKIAPERMEHENCPMIIHWQGGHWILLISVNKDKYRIADPASGVLTISKDEFVQKFTGYALSLTFDKAVKAPPKKEKFAWLVELFGPINENWGKMFLVATGISVIMAMGAIFLQRFIDNKLPFGDFPEYKLAGIITICVLIITIAHILKNILIAKTASELESVAVKGTAEKMLYLDYQWYMNRNSSDIQRRLEAAADLRDYLSHHSFQSAYYIIQLLVALAAIEYYNTTFLMSWLWIIPVYFILIYLFDRFVFPAVNRLKYEDSKIDFVTADMISGIESIKSAGAENYFVENLSADLTSYQKDKKKARFQISMYESLKKVTLYIAVAVTLFTGSWLYSSEAISSGTLIALCLLSALVIEAVMQIIDNREQSQYTNAIMNLIDDVYSNSNTSSVDMKVPSNSIVGKITVRDMNFSYSGTDFTLENISLNINPGEKICIAGKNGSGKSSLLNCLTGLLQPQEGEVLIDDVNLSEFYGKELRSRFGIICQQPYIFNASAAENITMLQMADEELIASAAKLAGIHEFISSLPLGYQTAIGIGGYSLTRDQEQRIAIARAFFNSPSVLFLDEVSSNLDYETTGTIAATLMDKFKNQTVVMVEHNPVFLRSADKIIVMDNGRIVEIGNHFDLMRKNGFYSELYKTFE